MKTWLIEQIIKYLVANLTEEKIKEWTDQLNNWLLPKLVAWKAEIFQKLHEAAADTSTPLDDLAVVALEKFVDQYIK